MKGVKKMNIENNINTEITCDIEPCIVYDGKWLPAYLWTAYDGVLYSKRCLTKNDVSDELWSELVEMYPPDLKDSIIREVWEL